MPVLRNLYTHTHTHAHTYIVRDVHTLSNTLLVLHRSLSALVSSSIANGDVRTTKRTTRVRSGSRNQSASASRINSSHTGTYTMLAKETHTHTPRNYSVDNENTERVEDDTHTLVDGGTTNSRFTSSSSIESSCCLSLSLLLAFE